MSKSKHKRITMNENSSKSTLQVNKLNPVEFGANQVENKSVVSSYLQPEILSIDLMKSLLLTRGADSNINKANDEHVRSLFYKHITPKPQRSLKNNRSNKVLIANRKLERKDFNYLTPKQDITKDEDYKCENKNSPVDEKKACINLSKTKIKLNCSSDNLDNIVIKKRKSSEENVNKNAKKICLEEQQSKEMKTVKLNREKNTQNKTSLTKHKSNNFECSKPKKERKSISWP